MADPTLAIETAGLTKHYGRHRAVESLDLQVPGGDPGLLATLAHCSVAMCPVSVAMCPVSVAVGGPLQDPGLAGRCWSRAAAGGLYWRGARAGDCYRPAARCLGRKGCGRSVRRT